MPHGDQDPSNHAGYFTLPNRSLLPYFCFLVLPLQPLYFSPSLYLLLTHPYCFYFSLLSLYLPFLHLIYTLTFLFLSSLFLFTFFYFPPSVYFPLSLCIKIILPPKNIVIYAPILTFFKLYMWDQERVNNASLGILLLFLFYTIIYYLEMYMRTGIYILSMCVCVGGGYFSKYQLFTVLAL